MEKSIGVLAHPIFNIYETLKRYLPNYRIHEIKHKGFGSSTAIPVDNINSEEYDALLKEIEQFEILIVDPYDILPIINDIRNVKWLQGTWSGVDVLTPIFNKDNLPKFKYTRFGGKYGQHLSEYVIAHIINTERKTRFFYEQQDKCIWAQAVILETPCRLLSQLSISILGVGDIGREVAKHCKGFGMTVYGMVSHQRENKIENIDELFTSSSLANYLEKSDYVVNILPKTPHTNGMLSNSILKNCANRQSVFINIGRGNVLNDADIVEAIENKWIQSAVVDVFEAEPLPFDSKLWGLLNVTVTPHVSGCFSSTEMVEVFIQNLKLYEEGKPLNYLVDWVRGY